MINHKLKIKDSIHELKSQGSGSALLRSEIYNKEPTPVERALTRIEATNKQIKAQNSKRSGNWKMR